jgi:hypothetical protein
MKRLLLAAAAALSLAACATPTPYQPYQPGGVASGGFTETRIANDRFRVTFQGNSLTDRERVERYLLFRAAELTVAQGHDWFALADRHTEADTRTRLVDNDPFGYNDFWRPSWYYVSRGRLVRVYEPYRYNPFPDYSVHRTTSYQASAEIFLGRGRKPESDRSAFDAREVINNLRPTIVWPQPR